MHPRWLGLDCGGSKTAWAWLPSDDAGDEVPDGEAAPADGTGPGVQPAVQGIRESAAALRDLLAAITQRRRPEAAVVAMAGVGDAAVRGELEAALARSVAFPVAIVADVLAAAAAALACGPGVLVWAGTGSFAVARDAVGRLHRVGGRGYLLGDQGSGYDLVRRAAAAVVLAADGLAEATALAGNLAAAFGTVPDQLGAALQRLSTGEVAARLPVVLEVAAAGDATALQVLEEGAEALAGLCLAAARRAGLDLGSTRVCFGGGVLTGVAAVAGPLQRHLAARGAAPAQVLPAHAAARGAARLARAAALGMEPLSSWVRHGSL